MTALITHFLLFADRSTMFRNMGSEFRDKRNLFRPIDLLWWVLAAAIILAVLVAIATIMSKHDKRRQIDDPRRLFRALCKVHGLDRKARNLLVQLARSQQISIPAKLFLDPERFDPAKLPVRLHVHRERFAALRDRLFKTSVVEADISASGGR